MFQYNDYKIYLACGKTDMRKSINGLCDIVENHFQLDPREKIMFAFCNHRRNRIKLMVWEDNGFWVHFKRLEKGSNDWPEPSDDNIQNQRQLRQKQSERKQEKRILIR